MYLETSRLILRRFTLEDIEKTFEYSNEESRKQGIPNEVYATFRDAENNVKFIISKYKENLLPLVLVIELKQTHEYIGHVSLSEIKRGVEIGYAVCEKYQSKGYATEAVIGFIEWCKERHKLDVIYGLILPGNIASKKVLEKAGFLFLKDDTDHQYTDGHYIVYTI